MEKNRVVEIGFENCDVMTIPAEKVKTMFARELSKSVGMRDGYYFEYIRCEEFFMIIDKEWIEELFYPFNNKQLGGQKSNRDRLKFGDIVSVGVREEDSKEVEDILVPWEDENEAGYVNKFHKAGVCENGDLWVSIMKEEKERFKELKKNWGCM